MKRGDVVTVAARGPYSGKPRPAVVVQSDLFNPTHPSVTVALVTSELRDAPLFRLTVEPGSTTGLGRQSQVMVDKLVTVPRKAVGQVLGALESRDRVRLGRALRMWLEI
ncbi:MAG: type II toxin-antitoxin system PemK/MazF family toxin [Myxococcota bacterium]